jgi:hypothetical protein
VDLYWRPHHEVNPILSPEPDFIAYDGEKVIGRVYEHMHGSQKGRWLWTMTDHGPGYPPPFAIHGEVADRGEAGRLVFDAYRRWREYAALVNKEKPRS